MRHPHLWATGPPLRGEHHHSARGKRRSELGVLPPTCAPGNSALGTNQIPPLRVWFAPNAAPDTQAGDNTSSHSDSPQPLPLKKPHTPSHAGANHSIQ